MAHQAGSRIRVTIDGNTYSSRQSVNVKATRIMNTVNTNHDGTVSYGTMAQPATAEIPSFDVGPADIDRFGESFMRDFHDVTILEIDRGVLHIFTQAKVIGEPVANIETGEVSGLSIAGDAYRRARV